jgi:hypothetical protein
MRNLGHAHHNGTHQTPLLTTVGKGANNHQNNMRIGAGVVVHF